MLNIMLDKITGFNTAQNYIVTRSTETGLKLIQEEGWRSQVEKSVFNENRGYSKGLLLDFLDKSNLKINVKSFHDVSNTIAYTYTSSSTTYFNDYHLDRFLKMPRVQGEAKVFGTIIHEAMHELGFVHRWPWHRSNTVPYGIQHITEQFYNQSLGE